MFGSAAGSGSATAAVDLKPLHAKIGELTLENDFLEGALSKAGLLSVSRGGGRLVQPPGSRLAIVDHH